jgi:hypothetical protein
VIYNRLFLGTPLQIDATLFYGQDPNATFSDVKGIDTPYNTYLHAGLPPTPIANPGRASIESALNPAPNPGQGDPICEGLPAEQCLYLYHVTIDKDGHHAFSATLAQQEANIVQDASTITITRTTQIGTLTSTYKLDGSESKNTLNIQGNSVDQVSTAKWDGGKLLVNTKMDFGGNPVELTMVMSLDPSGNLLVESTRPDFQGGGAPVTTKMSYKKN